MFVPVVSRDSTVLTSEHLLVLQAVRVRNGSTCSEDNEEPLVID